MNQFGMRVPDRCYDSNRGPAVSFAIQLRASPLRFPEPCGLPPSGDRLSCGSVAICRNSHLLPLLLTCLLVICVQVLAQVRAEGQGNSSGATANSLERARSAALERRYAEAIKILRASLREEPDNVALQLELGRVYLSSGNDGAAEHLFRALLARDSRNRDAKLELGRALANQQRYEQSAALFRQLLAANSADEAAAIGLASDLLHVRRSAEASTVIDAALVLHPNSLRLLEYRDRVAQGLLGGEERSLPAPGNLLSTATDYIDDSAGNHQWIVSERLDLRIRPGLTSELNMEQQLLHGLDDPLATAETYNEGLRWKALEWLELAAGGGATHFDTGQTHAIYGTSLSVRAANHWLLDGGFSRIPIVPDAEAADHRLTAQGWEAYSLWIPQHWQISMRASKRHYSDENVGAQQMAEALHLWSTPRMRFSAGCRFRHYGFSQDFAHGYFSPDNYQSHQAAFSAIFHPARVYRMEVTAWVGAESIASGADFQAAWELWYRNQIVLRHWNFSLDYFHSHGAQVTGAFRADAGRFEMAYHFDRFPIGK